MKPARKRTVRSIKSVKTGAKVKKTNGTDVVAPTPGARNRNLVERTTGVGIEFRMLIENPPALVHVAETAEEGRWLYVSQQIEAILGFSSEEWMANPKLWVNQIHPEDRERVLAEERSLAGTQAGEVTHWEYRLIHRDGHTVWVEADAVLVWEESVKKFVWQGVLTDVTARKKTEEELSRSYSLLHAALESTTDGLLVVDTVGKILSYNRKFLKLWRIPDSLAAQQNDRALLEFVLDQLKQPAEFLSKVEELYRSPEETSFDEIEFLDGRVFERYSQPQRLNDAVIGRVWSFRDVTERKQVEYALRLNEQRLRQIIDLVPHFIFAKDEEGRFILVNQAVAETYGTTVEELTGKKDSDFARSEEEVRHFRADDLEVLRSGKSKHIPEETITDARGNTHILATTKIPFTFSDTDSPTILGVSVDITDQRHVERALRESESRLLTVLEASPIPLTLNSLEDGIILYSNSASAELLGISLAELIGKQAIDFYTNPHDRQRMLIELELTGILHEYEVSMRRFDGLQIWVSLSCEKIMLEGRPCILSSLYDITERKRAEALQSAVYQISEAATKSSSMDELFRSVHAIIGQVMPAENFYIALYDRTAELLSFPYYRDEMDKAASIPTGKLGRGMTEYVLRTGKALLSDADNFEQLARAGEVELIGPPSPIWIGAPLILEGQTIGVIALQDYHDPKVYGERDLQMLEFVSGQVARAIERTRLYEDIQRNNRVLTALQEATVPLISQIELSEVLQAILKQATSLFESVNSYVYVVSPDESEVVLIMVLGKGEKYLGTRLKRGEGLAGKVWETGLPLNIPDYQTWPNRSTKFNNADYHAMLGVPLFSGSRVIGVLGISYMDSVRKFTNEDLELLSRFAQLASIAYENGHLYTLNRQELAERKIAEEALREAEAKYRTVVERISAITYTALMDDPKTRLYVSPQIETLLGYTPQEYLSEADLWKKMLHPDDYERVLEASNKFYEGGEPFVCDYRSVARDGRILWFHDEAVIYEDETTHKRFIQGIKVDITQRMQAEALQAAIYRISDATGIASMEEFYRTVHQALQSVMKADNFFIALYDREKDLLSFPYFVDECDPLPATAPLGNGPTAYVIHTGAPLFGKPDTIRKLEESGYVKRAGTESIDWLGVPLKIQNETIGVMVVQTYTEGVRYTARELDILGFVSHQVSASLERKQAEAAVRNSESRYRLSARATNDVVWEWDIPGGRRIWSENLHTLFGYTPEETGENPAWWNDRIHPQDRERVVSTLEAFLQGIETNWEDEYRFIRSDDTVAYVIDRGYLERDSDGAPLRMIGAMADNTERKHREDELEALASVSAALRVAGSRAEILQIVLDQVMKQFEARGAALTLRRPGMDDLYVEAAGGEWAGYLGIKAPLSGGVSRHVMDSGRPYVTNDLERDELMSLNGMAKGAGSFISVPLSTPSGMIGAMNLGRHAPLMPEDVRLLMNIADLAANAIQRASAFEQIKLQIERLKALRTIDMFIASGTDLRLTFQTILNQAVAQLGVDAADILLLNPSMHVLEFSEGLGFRTSGIQQTVLRIGEGFAGLSVLRREAISVDDLSSLDHPLFTTERLIWYRCIPLVAKGEVKGVLEVFHRSPKNVDSEWMDFLESLAGQAALALDNSTLFESLQRSNIELGLAYETTLEGWSAALDLRDKETEGHTRRVTELTLKLSEAMGVSEKDRVHIRRGALLHDIGKMGIPDRILLKPDVLTGEEWEIMRQHPVYAHNLLSQISHLRSALDIPYCHHERWDGSGYPRGLKEEVIPLAARIFAVADVWDALCSDRPYRPAWAREKALDYIKSLSGVHFDPQVVESFLHLVGEG